MLEVCRCARACHRPEWSSCWTRVTTEGITWQGLNNSKCHYEHRLVSTLWLFSGNRIANSAGMFFQHAGNVSPARWYPWSAMITYDHYYQLSGFISICLILADKPSTIHFLEKTLTTIGYGSEACLRNRWPNWLITEPRTTGMINSLISNC